MERTKVNFRICFNVEYRINPDKDLSSAGKFDPKRGIVGTLDTTKGYLTFEFQVADIKTQLNKGDTLFESMGIIPDGATFDVNRWISVGGWPRNVNLLWISNILIGNIHLLTKTAQREFVFRCFQNNEMYNSATYPFATYAINGIRNPNEGVDGGPCVKYILSGAAGASWLVFKEPIDLNTLADSDTMQISLKMGQQEYEKWTPEPVVIAPKTTPSPTYEIGPGKKYEKISDMPWESLRAGDVVYIYWQEKPYQEKIGIDVQGSADKPVIIHGVPAPDGQLPKIDGRHAVTRETMPLFGQTSRLVSMGVGNRPTSYVIIENLEICNANKFNLFYPRGDNKLTAYNEFCAGLYIQWGENITIRNCIFHDCSNGLFVSSYSSLDYYSGKLPLESELVYASRNILVEGNYFYNNGVPGRMFEHHSYCAAINTTYQFNHYGMLIHGSTGYGIKDRGSGTVIRYNWIEDGRRQISLDDAQDCQLIALDAKYIDSYVYGNVLIEPDGGFRVWGEDEIISFGGDDENTLDRIGTLYFTNNTIVTYRTRETYAKYNVVDWAKGREPRTCLLYMPMRDQSAEVKNNIFYRAGDAPLTILNDSGIDNPSGTVVLSHNWLSEGWTDKMEGFSIIRKEDTNITGQEPGFVSLEAHDFHLVKDSTCVNNGLQPEVPPNFEYTEPGKGITRVNDNHMDIGAFEYQG